MSLMPDILVPLHHASNPFVHHVKVSGQPLPSPSSSNPALVPFRSSQLPASSTHFTHEGRIRTQPGDKQRASKIDTKSLVQDRQLSNGRYQIPRARTNSETTGSSYSHKQLSQQHSYESNWSSGKSMTADADLVESPVYVFSGQRERESKKKKAAPPPPQAERSSSEVTWDSLSKSAIKNYDFER